MKLLQQFPLIPSRLIAAGLGLLPFLAAAHPGHYHPPGEEDEFDQLRADWLHLHGLTEFFLAAMLIGSLLVFRLHKNRNVRIGAIVTFGGSLTLLAAL
jgi:hypothetical protein